jgi:hypothetical protein
MPSGQGVVVRSTRKRRLNWSAASITGLPPQLEQVTCATEDAATMVDPVLHGNGSQTRQNELHGGIQPVAGSIRTDDRQMQASQYPRFPPSPGGRVLIIAQ